MSKCCQCNRVTFQPFSDHAGNVICKDCLMPKSDELTKLRAQLEAERGWHKVVQECEQIFGCEDTAESPLMSNLPNLVRDFKTSRVGELETQLESERSARQSAEAALVDLQRLLWEERECHAQFVNDMGTTCWECPECGHAISGRGCVWCELKTEKAAHEETRRELAALQDQLEKAPEADCNYLEDPDWGMVYQLSYTNFEMEKLDIAKNKKKRMKLVPVEEA